VAATIPTVTGSNIEIYGDGPSSVIQVPGASLISSGNAIGLKLDGASYITIRDVCFDGNFANIAKGGGQIVVSTFGSGGAQVSSGANSAPAAGTVQTWTVNAAAVTAAAAYAANPFVILVGAEWVLVQSGAATTSWTVMRGFQTGTSPVPSTHANGSALTSTFTDGRYDAAIAMFGVYGPKNYLSNYAAGSIDLAGGYLTSRMPLFIQDCTDIVVSNCTVKNSITGGLVATGSSRDSCSGLRVEDCYFTNGYDNAVFPHGGVADVVVEGCEIYGMQYSGVGVTYSRRLTIVGNRIAYCGPSWSDSGGITLAGCDDALIAGNEISNTCAWGVGIEPTTENGITGGYGANPYPCHDVTISGNVIHDLVACGSEYPSGVALFGAEHCTVEGGEITRIAAYGVNLYDHALNCTIRGATIQHTGYNGVCNGASGLETGVWNTAIEGCKIRYTGQYGVLQYGGGRTVITDNTIEWTTESGIIIGAVAASLEGQDVRIERNTFNGIGWYGANPYNGIELGGATTGDFIAIRNNTFDNNDWLAMDSSGVATTSSTTFTDSLGPFVSGDTGNTIVIFDATGGVVLTTTMTYVSATQVTLTTAPTVTLATASYLIYRPLRFQYYRGVWGNSVTATVVMTGNLFRKMGLISWDALTSVSGSSTIVGNVDVGSASTPPAYPSQLYGIAPVLTGTATLAGGTIAVVNANVTANSIVRVSNKTDGGTPGALYISARSAGTSFTIKSTSGTDTSVVYWEVLAW
jgi:hypothetical protein